MGTVLLDDKSGTKEIVSSSSVLEVATSTVTKVIEDAQKKMGEDTTIKTSMEDDTKSDPKGNNEIIAETDNKPGKEKQLDWKDDKDGAEGLKSKLLEDKRDAVVNVMTVAKETVTKVIEDAKQKVAEKSADKTTTIEDGGDKDKKDVATENSEEIGGKSDPSNLEKDAKPEDANEIQDSTVAKGDEAIPNTTIGENADETSSKEAALNWRDDKGGVKGLKATLLEEKAEEEGAAGNEALISAAKETVTKVIEDAKQKVSGGESSQTVSTEGKIETDIKVKGEEGTRSTNKEEKPEQTLNWRDDKDGAKGLKTMLEDSNKSAQGEAEIDMMTTFVGTLKIKIHEAKDLEKKDLVQKADPYVVVRFGSQESKSDKVKNSLTPVWTYETTRDLQRASPRMIEIQLMDWERIGKDEPMGKVLLPVGEAVKKSDSFWMDLQDCKSGKILISTEFSGSDAKAVIGGGVKELRNMLKSDKSNTESDEKGLTLEPKDGLNPAKTENDEAKQQSDDTAGNKNAKKEEKERAQAEAEQAAADEAAAAKAATHEANEATRRANEDAVRDFAEEIERAILAAEEDSRITAEKENTVKISCVEANRVLAAEAARTAAAVEARIAAEEAAKLAAEEAARLAAEEAARTAAEEAARLAAEEAVRIAAEEAARIAAEGAARIAAEEAAKLAAEEAARLAAE